MKRCLAVMFAFLLVAAFVPRPAAAAVDFGLKGGLALSNLDLVRRRAGGFL